MVTKHLVVGKEGGGGGGGGRLQMVTKPQSQSEV